jgi:nitrite reductase (NADH) large subunit
VGEPAAPPSATLKACTQAGSHLRRLRAAGHADHEGEMAKRGLAVNNHLCEHFAYSRQELYHLMRVGQIKTFDELLAKHGKGRAATSASPRPHPSGLAAGTSTSWRSRSWPRCRTPTTTFLANMQKDGSYSVVPRMPGGEITPHGLIAVGQVAKKYGLYTKITGGQRIDLFGARVDQLPLIWQELIAAGFETGHAYGKALRTVKSCVGSTWCRYGVQDSVGLAIELENRYKGLRSPHKIKFAVSGCTRECAEAQGKDVGVIATDKGWNLYVCGNGGMKPRHAELIASDLTMQRPDPLHRPLPDVLRAHRRPPAAHQHLAARTSKAAWTTCARW